MDYLIKFKPCRTQDGAGVMDEKSVWLKKAQTHVYYTAHNQRSIESTHRFEHSPRIQVKHNRFII